MNLTNVLKCAAGWYITLLPLTLLAIFFGGHAFLAVLRFVLESLNSFGAA